MIRGNAIIVTLLVIFNSVDASEWVVRDASIMGTTIHVEVWDANNNLAKQAVDEVMRVMHFVNDKMSPYKESSELSIVNKHAATRPVAVSAEVFALIRNSLHFSEITNGAFDITFASVGHLYDYRESKRPSQKEIADHLSSVNFRYLKLDENASSVHFLHPKVRVDLGGIAKGYAVDLAVEKVQKMGVKHVLVSAGGDSRIIGDRQGRPWVIGIRHPQNKDNIIAKIPLSNEALSTSGDYERYFDEDGVRYHHILNPMTGDSAREVLSVTILGPRAIDTDALSTSVFVLGPKKGMELLESLPKIEGILVDADGNLLYSSGLQTTL